MKSKDRKNKILEILINSDELVTGSSLAEAFGVTRQVIVRDIAILKAEKYNIVSTARGYILQSNSETSVKRTINVKHNMDAIEDELKIIVDLGGRVLTTLVEHPIYGTLNESLNVKSMKDIRTFLERINISGAKPLLALTNGVHMHTIEADNEMMLDEICDALKESGYLIL